ncbi:MAG: hypothetical protein HC877_23685 [Thioploca sp.]|nr:hypothetical protein [Thioploca sp.]
MKSKKLFFIVFICLILIISFTLFFSQDKINLIQQDTWNDSFKTKTEHNFESVWNSYDKETKDYLIERYDYYYVLYNNINSNFTLAEREYFLGKVTKNDSRKCNSIQYYEDALNEFGDTKLIHEILYFVSLECGKDYEKYEPFLLNISSKGKQNIYSNFINKNEFPFKPYKIRKQEIQIPSNFSHIIIGESYIKVDNNTIIGTQIERIIRDWASNIINVYPSEYKQLIAYGEGDNLIRAVNNTSAKIVPLTSTIVIKSKDKWYAPDENGIFRFEVLPEKVDYPTNKCYGNICLIIDTHGISSLVSQAIENNVSLVIGCGDYVDKMTAAQYLAEKGINSFFPADRFIGNTINYQGEGVLIGTAPIRNNIIGNQSISINKNELIIVQDNYESYPSQYYDSPKNILKN